MLDIKSNGFDKAFVIGSSLLVIYLFYPAMALNIEYIKSYTFIQDDSLIYIPPFYKYLPESVPSTYENEYILKSLIPIGYKFIYVNIAKFYDLLLFSKYLPHCLLVFTVMIMAYASYRLSGALGCICTLFIVLSFSGDVMLRLGFYGAAPRSFAYPIVALTAFALIQGRPYLLAIVTLVSALIYPLGGIISGCAMSLMLLLPSSFCESIRGWSFKKRVFLIVGVASLCAIVLLPQVMAGTEYGSRVNLQSLDSFPEAGLDGKYLPGDKLPQSYNFTWAMQFFKYSFVPNGVPFSDIAENEEFYSKVIIALWGGLFFIIAIGLQQIVKPENSPVVRLLLLFASGVLLFILSVAVQPYLYFPKRYFMFTLPVFLTVIYPYALIKLLSKIKYIDDKNTSGQIATVFTLAIVLTFGGRGYWDGAASLEPEQQAFIDDVAKMDKGVLISGLPYNAMMSQISFLSKRNTFFSHWEHHTIHEDNMLNMREKYKSIIKAVFASDIEDVKKLRDEYNVTHMLINQDNYINLPDGRFEPFKYPMEQAFDKKDEALFNNNADIEGAIVIQHGNNIIYDINKVIGYYEG